MTRFDHLFSRSALTIYLSVAALFTILTFLVAIDPATRLKHEDAASPVPAIEPSAARGRVIYMAEGCGYCHSQLVRPALIDTPYGRPSRAADYAGAKPPLAGTQRNGPDLSAVGERQTSHVWNLYHLFNPRSMVPASIMPSYPWYFDIIDQANAPAGALTLVLDEPFLSAGKVALPKPEALDLVAYLLSVKQR